jgi:hypothetical protein
MAGDGAHVGALGIRIAAEHRHDRDPKTNWPPAKKAIASRCRRTTCQKSDSVAHP